MRTWILKFVIIIALETKRERARQTTRFLHIGATDNMQNDRHKHSSCLCILNISILSKHFHWLQWMNQQWFWISGKCGNKWKLLSPVSVKLSRFYFENMSKILFGAPKTKLRPFKIKWNFKSQAYCMMEVKKELGPIMKAAQLFIVFSGWWFPASRCIHRILSQCCVCIVFADCAL